MACVICSSQLEKHKVKGYAYNPDKGRKAVMTKRGELHCPKCKIIYKEDPDGQDIKEVDKR